MAKVSEECEEIQEFVKCKCNTLWLCVLRVIYTLLTPGTCWMVVYTGLHLDYYYYYCTSSIACFLPMITTVIIFCIL